MLQLLFLRCHPYEECKHQNLKKYKIPFFVHFMWRDSGCRGDIPRNCFFFTPILASIRALYFWLAIFSLIGDWKGLLTVNKDIPCCFKPGTLSNKFCLISVMKTPALLSVFVHLRIWAAKLLFYKICCTIHQSWKFGSYRRLSSVLISNSQVCVWFFLIGIRNFWINDHILLWICWKQKCF